jgi:hypothetical protein
MLLGTVLAPRTARLPKQHINEPVYTIQVFPYYTLLSDHQTWAPPLRTIAIDVVN